MKIQINFLLSTILICAIPSHAQWGQAADEFIELPAGLSRTASICSDGNGGCWVASQSGQMCHVDREGNLTWDDVLEPFPNYWDGAGTPTLADNGDVILTKTVLDWEIVNPGPFEYPVIIDSDVYIQRVNLDRERLWGEDGIAIDNSGRLHSQRQTIAGPIDNTYLIHWFRHDVGYNNRDPRLHLINGDGEFLWGAGGIGLNWSRSNSKIAITSDHCVIVAQMLSPNVEVVKINADGEQLWEASYPMITDPIRNFAFGSMEADLNGGVMIAYEYFRYENINDSLLYYGINVMRISAEGDSLWTTQVYERGVVRGTSRLWDLMPIINYAGSGHFFVAWSEWHETFQVVALDMDGEFLWDDPVDIISRPDGYPQIKAVNSINGMCYAFNKVDLEVHDWWHMLWGQRISLDGERLWGDDGRVIQITPVENSKAITDGNGGMITGTNRYSFKLQMINSNGEIGVVLEADVDEDIDELFPQLNMLSPNFPNPFNSSTIVTYTARNIGFVNLSLTDNLGRVVRSWAEPVPQPGEMNIVIDGSGLAAGNYYLKATQNGKMNSTKLVLLR